MKRVRLLATVAATICFIFIVSARTVKAQDVHSCSYELTATINTNNSVNFHEALTILNNSDANILSSFDLYFPYTLLTFTANIENHSLGVLKEPAHARIDLGDYFLKQSEKKVITLDYTAEIAATNGKDFKVFYLPQNQYCHVTGNKTYVNFPLVWGEPTYNSAGLEINPGKLLISDQQDVYLVWGQPSSQPLDLVWQVDAINHIALPGPLFSSITINELPQGTSVYKDDLQNQFLELNDAKSFSATFKATVNPYSQPKEQLKQLNLKYPLDLSVLDLDPTIDIKGAYSGLLEKFTPELTSNSKASLNAIDSIGETEQDALTYAHYWAATLQSKGVQAYVLFGPAEIPLSDNLIWDYWVGAYIDGKWTQYDPFLDDLMKFPQFGQVTPQRQTWGIISQDSLQLIGVLDNIRNSQTMLTRTDGAGVLGASFAVDAVLEVKNELTRDLELKITNNGSNIVFLESINLGNAAGSTAGGKYLGLLPKQTKTLELKGVPDVIQLLQDNGRLQAELKILSNDRTYSIVSNQVNFKQLWIFGLVFGGIFIFAIALCLLFKQAVFKMGGKLNLAVKNYSNRNLEIQKGTLAERKSARVNFPEPRDFPDLYRGIGDD